MHKLINRTARVVGAAGIILGLTVTIPVTSAATGGYPYAGNCNGADPWRFYKCQCTSFVAWKLNSTNGLPFNNDFDGNGSLDFRGASNWKAAAQAFGYRVDNNPAAGSVAWEKNGNHVAWVEAVQSNTVTIQEYNYNWSGTYNRRTAPRSEFEYIHFKDLVPVKHAFTPGVFNAKDTNYQFHLSNKNQANPADHIFNYANRTSHHTVVAGDWDGNGTTTVGVVGNSGDNLRWFLRNSNSGGDANIVFNYGKVGDIPIVGDWDGNGTVTPGLVRKHGNQWQWHLRNHNSAGPAQHVFLYGDTTGTPIAGDWNGNGTWSQGIVYKHGSGNLRWLLRNSLNSGPYQIEVFYGKHHMTPIAGDWDGNGTFTPGAVEKKGHNLQWHLRNSNTSGPGDVVFTYGSSTTHTPIVGNWDGRS